MNSIGQMQALLGGSDQQVSRHRDLALRLAFGLNLPGPSGVRTGQAVAQDGLANQDHVIRPFGLGALLELCIAQGIAVSQLRKRP